MRRISTHEAKRHLAMMRKRIAKRKRQRIANQAKLADRIIDFAMAGGGR